MSKYQHADALQGLTLGKTTDYVGDYTPDLLQGIPRSLNRDQLGIDETYLPFKGEDIWYGYELSWLNLKGKPVVAVAEFRIPCLSLNIVESKSFKLYLNSFNQSRFSSRAKVQQHLQEDIAKTVGCDVEVNLFPVEQCPPLAINALAAICIDDIDVTIDTYDLNDELLKNIQKHYDEDLVEEQLVSHLLKSNCLITNQPDWASVYISYKGAPLCHETLLKYVVSFRQHNEFHEQCVERMFCDLQKYCSLSELTVFARYTRRGGLDINPYRSTETTRAPNCRTYRQ